MTGIGAEVLYGLVVVANEPGRDQRKGQPTKSKSRTRMSHDTVPVGKQFRPDLNLVTTTNNKLQLLHPRPQSCPLQQKRLFVQR